MTYTNAITTFWDETTDTTEFDDATSSTLTADQSSEGSKETPLDKKIDSWRNQLIDLTRRNHLVNFTTTKSKSLPLYRADPRTIVNTLADGDSFYVRRSASEEDGGNPPDPEDLDEDELASTRDREATANSLSQLKLKETRFQQEKGVDSLFIALGSLRWYEAEHSDEQLRSPLFLVPVTLSEESTREKGRHDYAISTDEPELLFNPALRKKLAVERGITLPDDDAFTVDNLTNGFAHIETKIAGFDRWSVVPDCVLGIFDFAKYSLYADLEENREAIKGNPLVQAMNGDLDAVKQDVETPTADQLDETVSAGDVFQVLDADSSQQEAIEAAKNGLSFVLQGPPGTGKSQTIANIIAEKMADDETVLFVSEKQAALDVVRSRLADVGLGRFCLNAHGEYANKKRVLESLGQELRSDPLERPSDRSDVVEELDRTKAELNAYSDYLFESPAGQDRTTYDVFGIVANNDDAPRIEWSGPNPLELDQQTIDSLEQHLSGLAEYDEQVDNYEESPWRHTTISDWGVDTRDRVEDALGNLRRTGNQLDDARTRIETALDVDVDSVKSLREAAEFVELLAECPDVVHREEYFTSDFYDREGRFEEFATTHREYHDEREELVEKYSETFLGEDGASLYDELTNYGLLRFLQPSYYRLKGRLQEEATGEYDPGFEQLKDDAKLLRDLQRLDDELDQYGDLRRLLGQLFDGRDTDWETVLEYRAWIAEFEAIDTFDVDSIANGLVDDGGLDIDAEELAESTRKALSEWDDAIDDFDAYVDTDELLADWETEPPKAISGFVAELEDDLGSLQEWVQFKHRLETVQTGPAGDFVDTFLDSGHPATTLVSAFKRSFYTQWLNGMYRKTPLSEFSATEYSRLVDRFRKLDEQQREYAKAEIQHRVTNRRPTMTLEHADSSAQAFLRREIKKSRMHEPLRTIFARAADLVTDLKPCFMMSPLSVAQYLEYGELEFDCVIFDEASQIMPQDAVSSIIRGDQVVIAGDSKQLPPTSFFDADVETDEGVREDLESILDEAGTVLPEKYLQWHYRSRTDELIEFSNLKYYDGRLQTFPENNPSVETGVEFDYVPDGVYDRGGSSTNTPEANHVIDRVEEHVEEAPDKSLGVIAFSQAQTREIRDQLEVRRDKNPALDTFVSEDDALEGFFIKSLENVQGDERDRLIFSVGYGPDSSGKISMNFGPLSQSGGHRRLNVAVTRAKEKVTVVSSLQPGEIDPSNVKHRGVEDFKHYLEYAKHGQHALDREDTEPETLQFDSGFEEAVYTEFEERGYDVASQVSSSGYSIDLAIRHPERPGEYLLGIECDGAAYHSSKTARDRDRTRQAVLEDLGWRIHRIWSPDWVANKEEELADIEEKIEVVQTDGGSTLQQASTTEVDSVEIDAIPEAERDTIESEMTPYEPPRLSHTVSKDFDEISDQLKAKYLVAVVDAVGPVRAEVAYRTVIERWQLSRLTQNMRDTFGSIERRLIRQDELARHDDFLWPTPRPKSILLRNHDVHRRDIEKVPPEELVVVQHHILRHGREMTREDLILETARLYDYQRTGKNIKSYLDYAVTKLVEAGGATQEENLEYVEKEIDTVLLDDVYD
ncbi:DUF4011 domain-containing protein [Halorussus litoreus]|uniref:DUF4011 domain-containing protein n=1 Tax=Halorussus litoreus TaxID=1710536 RepID=UPI000E24807C|nr:DUF4011 domain-containing protein [Halorussus litoreus]